MNGFRKSLMVGAAAAAMMLSGCAQPGTATGGRATSSGSLALSSDDSTLFAVDTDNGVVAAIDTNSQTKLYSVKVGNQPARVITGPDDTVYVTNRGDNSISVIRKGDQVVSKTIQVGTEPVGIAVSPDNKMIYVVNATASDTSDYGTMTAISTTTLEPVYELPLGAEPRGIVLLSNDKAAISLYREGEILEVDLKNKKVLNPQGIGIYDKVNLSAKDPSIGGYSAFSTFHSRAMTDLVATPDGTRVFAPVIWAREDPIGKKPAAGGYYSSGGPCNLGSVASAGLVVADLGNSQPNGGQLEPKVDDLTSCYSSGTTSLDRDYPITTLGEVQTLGALSLDPTVKAPNPIQGPVAAAVDATGSWLYIVNRESSTVAILPAFRRSGEDLRANDTGSSVRFVIPVGQGADGIALTKDGLRAFVYSQFDHRIDLIKSQVAADQTTYTVTKTSTIPVEKDTLPSNLVAGRKMFFDATNLKISANTTQVSCATCHLEGMDDGHTWSFPDGPRQTPALAGRHLKDTAPYHWSGEFNGDGTTSAFKEFMTHTIQERMGGTGLISDSENDNISNYIDSLPAPKNANLGTTLTAVQQHGKDLYFGAAQCSTCHVGAALTDNSNHDVGTLVTTGRSVDNVALIQTLNVPSLIGIARTAPYLHDGSVATLRARLDNDNGAKHGKTEQLTDADKDALTAYLKTL
jgi:YVTN family beta-propeller protein